MGSPGILEVIKKPMPLERDDQEVWSLTVGPLASGSYAYGYAIDGGRRMPDRPITMDCSMWRLRRLYVYTYIITRSATPIP